MRASFRSPLLAIPFLLVVGCSAETAPPTTSESEQTSSNCSHIPDCKEFLEASDGPVSASITTIQGADGVTRRQLSVRYVEAPGSSFLVCDRFPRQPKLNVTFVTGPENARQSVNREMNVECPTSYGDNGTMSDSASFGVGEQEDPALWDTLFPPHADGTRWFALQVAMKNARGEWDSRFGQNYRLVFRRR